MNAAPTHSTRAPLRRNGFLLKLDILLFVLTCVLESLSLTGLQLHEWLGFVLCPLVVLHVVLQWQWFATQFRRVLAPGAYRARVNLCLNILLLVLMAAVLISGVLVSNQIAAVVGNHLGRNRIWSEIHGWLNFALIVVVGLHLALNWDWILAAIRRRSVQRPALVGISMPDSAATSARHSKLARSLWRTTVVLVASSLASFAIYLAMSAMLPANHGEKQFENRGPGDSQVGLAPEIIPIKTGRPAHLSDGFRELAVTVSVSAFLLVLGRYVFHIRL